MQSRMISQVSEGGLQTMECFQKTNDALAECAAKATEGNARCDNVMAEATEEATAKREAEREAINAQSTNIQTDLNLCQDMEIEDALSCYEEKVGFHFSLVDFYLLILFFHPGTI